LSVTNLSSGTEIDNCVVFANIDIDGNTRLDGAHSLVHVNNVNPGTDERFVIERVELEELVGEHFDPEGPDDRFLALRLTPRGAEMQKRMQRITLLLDRNRRHLRRVRMRFSDAEWTEYRFSNVRLNVKVPDDRFRLKLPDDVEVSRPAESDRP